VRGAAPVELRITVRYLFALYLVVMLWASLHELIHHVAGYIVCGAWGYKTFNYFRTACEATPQSWAATYAGPALSFAAMWYGWWLLRKAPTNWQRHLGFAVIFAQLPAQRLTGPLLGQNDEYFAARHMFGNSITTMWITFALIACCTVPPLIGAWRSIANTRRAAWFLLYFLLLPYLVWGPAFVTLEYLLVDRHVLDGRTVGIANLFVLNELVTIVAYVACRRWIDPWRNGSAATPARDRLTAS
jgi:hypothetical protein